VSSSARRVLIVEDEVILALDISDAAAALGYHIVGPALSLREGVQLALSEPIDCALLDVNLGHGQTSQPIAEILRERDVRLVFLTAYDRKQITFAKKDEMVMRKPPNAAELDQVISSLCG
jgi:CheY-like chemotaxis protein